MDTISQSFIILVSSEDNDCEIISVQSTDESEDDEKGGDWC